MCPSIECRENPIQLIGNTDPDWDVYAFVIDLQTPDQLAAEEFDTYIKALFRFDPERKFDPLREENLFKWIGFNDRLAIFFSFFDHDEVYELLKNGSHAATRLQGAGHLDILPDDRSFWGCSQNLVDFGYMEESASQEYKLRFLPQRLGRDGFSYRP